LQQRLIEEWLKERVNQEKYYECLEEWDRLNQQYHPNEDSVWDKLLYQIQEYEQPALTRKNHSYLQLVRWLPLLIYGYLMGEYK
jgi:hypothetical protein